jgi:hypothetical protein
MGVHTGLYAAMYIYVLHICAMKPKMQCLGVRELSQRRLLLRNGLSKHVCAASNRKATTEERRFRYSSVVACIFVAAESCLTICYMPVDASVVQWTVKARSQWRPL